MAVRKVIHEQTGETKYYDEDSGRFVVPETTPGFFSRLGTAATEAGAGVTEGATGIVKGLASLPGQVANLPSAYRDLFKSFQAAPGRTVADVGRAAASMLPFAGSVQDIAVGEPLTVRGVAREMTELALPMRAPKALAGIRDVGTAIMRKGPTSRVYRGAEASRMAQQTAYDLLGPPTQEAVTAGYQGARAAGGEAGRTAGLSVWDRLAHPKDPALPGWQKGQFTPELQAIGERLEMTLPGQVATGRAPKTTVTQRLEPGERPTVPQQTLGGYERTSATPSIHPQLNELFHAYQLTNDVIGKSTGGLELAQAKALRGALSDKLAELARGEGPSATAAQRFLEATQSQKRLWTAEELRDLVQRSTLPVGAESERVNLGKFMHKLRYPRGRTELTATMANQVDPAYLERLSTGLEPARKMMPEQAPYRLGGVASRYGTAGGFGGAAGELLGRALGLPPAVGALGGAASGALIQRGLESYGSSPAGIARTQAAWARPYRFGTTPPAIELGPLGPAAAENDYLRRILGRDAP